MHPSARLNGLISKLPHDTPKPTYKLLALLYRSDIPFELHVHTPVISSTDAVMVRDGYSLDQGVKALLLRHKQYGEYNHILCCVPGSKRLDNKTLRNVLGVSKISFVPKDTVPILTNGIIPGGVPPAGILFNAPTLYDEKILDHDTIIWNAGHQQISIAIRTKDMINLVKPTIESFSCN